MKGQTSVEWLFIVAIIMTVVVIVLVDYSGEADRTLVEVTIRNQVDLSLSRMAFAHPECTNAKLTNVTLFQPTPSNMTYVAFLSPDSCSGFMNSRYPEEIQGKITEVLGCRYDPEGTCKGKIYNVYFS